MKLVWQRHIVFDLPKSLARAVAENKEGWSLLWQIINKKTGRTHYLRVYRDNKNRILKVLRL